MRRPSNERRLTGPFATGFRMTISSMTETATPATVLADVLLAPLLAALLYLLISRDGQGHGATLPAVVGTASMQTVLLSGSALLRDRLEGTLAHLALGPRIPVRLWAGRFAALASVGFAGSAVTWAATCALFHLGTGGAPDPVPPLMLLAASLASCGLGAAVAACSLAARDALFLVNLCGFAIPLLCGLVAPVSVLPVPLRWLAYALPTSWMTDAARAYATGDAGSAWRRLVVGVMAGMAWLLVAMLVLKAAAVLARRDGTFDATAM